MIHWKTGRDTIHSSIPSISASQQTMEVAANKSFKRLFFQILWKNVGVILCHFIWKKSCSKLDITYMYYWDFELWPSSQKFDCEFFHWLFHSCEKTHRIHHPHKTTFLNFFCKENVYVSLYPPCTRLSHATRYRRSIIDVKLKHMLWHIFLLSGQNIQ